MKYLVIKKCRYFINGKEVIFEKFRRTFELMNAGTSFFSNSRYYQKRFSYTYGSRKFITFNHILFV